MSLRLLAVLAAVACPAHSAKLSTVATSQANPIRKVVTLLTNLQKKVKEEGEKEEELYKKFMCYCKTGVSQLREQIEAAGEKGPQLEAAIKESEEQLKQCKQDLKTA